MMNNEEMVKLKSQVVSCTINFVKGLIEKDEDDVDDKGTKHTEILVPYQDALVQGIQSMLDLSIKANYAPLQGETLGLISVLAEVMTDQFVKHYTPFMSALKQILEITPQQTQDQKDLRANCISCMGAILEAVKDQPDLCR
jgi:hypothetical protein